MRKLALLSAAALLLSGCATTSHDATEEPEIVEISPNEAACGEFSEVSSRIMDPFEQTDANALELWSDVQASFDTVALTADGEVRDRMLALVDEWPEVVDVILYDSGRTLINEHLDGIARACSAEGFDLDYHKYAN